jgi:tripartite-type tricarboxylate transporter receptor subunit TctC
MRGGLRLVAALLLTMVGGGAVRAEDARDFYRGKTVRIVIGVGVGGGFDSYARLLAAPLSRALGASVVVESMPGAGQLVALNRVYAGQPDGLSVLFLNGTPAALGQILEQDNARYDLTRMDHLGIVNSSPWMWLAGPKSGIARPRDAMTPGRKVLWGGTGPTGGLSDGASITCEALKLDCKVILGYKSSSDVALAVERGELDSIYVSDSSAVHYARGGRAIAVAAVSRQRSKLMPDTPTLFEALDISPTAAAMIDFRSALDGIGRILVTTPGTPPDRLAVLREAIHHVLTDPEVIAEGAASERLVDFRDATTAREMVTRALTGISADEKAVVRAAVLDKFR